MFSEDYVAHDAMENCKMLQNLVEKSSKENMFEGVFFSVLIKFLVMV
jgi:hypothetical protein